MTTDGLIEAGIDQKMKEGAKEGCDIAARNREAQKILASHVSPFMPRSLEDCWELVVLSTGFGNYPTFMQLYFKPNSGLNSFGERDKRVALGTIDKVVDGLEKGGWKIGRRPAAKLGASSQSITVELGAAQNVTTYPARRWFRRGAPVERHVQLNMNFTNLAETEQCKLVEREVTVEAVPEYTETQMVLDCNGEDSDANQG